MLRIRSILVPIDFSFAADHALEVAHSLARDHRAKLVLFAVAVPSQATMDVELPESMESPDSKRSTPWPRAEYEFRRQLESVAAAIGDVPVVTQVCSGAPGTAIVTAAAVHNADLIVMGTQGRTGLSRLLLGSVAEYVLRHATCPVLTVKPRTAPHLQQDQLSEFPPGVRP